MESWNINNVEEQIRSFLDYGIDGVIFQCLQYPFGLQIPNKLHMNFPYFPLMDSIKPAIDKMQLKCTIPEALAISEFV